MARLAMSNDFQRDYGKLEKALQDRVDELARKLREHKHAGLHLEKYNNQHDPRARTIRINDNFRGILMAADDDLFILTRILPHDQADQWMMRNEFKVNEASGALEVIDVVYRQEVIDASAGAAPSTVDLFAHRKDKDFVQLGVTALPIPVLRRMADQDDLMSLLQLIPPMQAEAVVELLGESSVDEIFARLVADEPVAVIDTTDIEAALERPVTKAAFAVVTTDDELRDLLAQPFALWRTYLHPSQRRHAYKPVYNGPVRVTGGPGTGKTVVAMHRVKALVDALEDTSGKPVLMTTFTTNLARSIEADLRLLGGPELLERVEVRNIDALAMAIVREHEGGRPRVAGPKELRDLWQQVIDEHGVPYTQEFLNAEWVQVVLARSISSRDDYLKVARPGRGIRLNRKERVAVWNAIEAFTTRLAGQGLRTFLQLAVAAAGYVQTRTIKPYRHVVVDEAQDLHEAQWRLIRALVDPTPNDLFIVGDSHQRIYDNRASLGQVGIKIVGRSFRLTTCYRTTRQILRWSLELLGEGDFDDLDDGTDTLAGYHAFISGPPPQMLGSASRAAELEALVEVVKGWIDAGINPDEIGIAARTAQLVDGAATALSKAGLSSYQISTDDDHGSPTAVRLGTMHRMKGLEFRCVAVVDVDDTTVPQQWSLVDRSVDQLQHDAELRQERCLLYVACSRAREHLAVLWAGKPSRFLEPLLR